MKPNCSHQVIICLLVCNFYVCVDNLLNLSGNFNSSNFLNRSRSVCHHSSGITPLTVALIDQAALRHNLNVVRTTAPHSKIMAMVKADGYGHGVLFVAQALSDADAFGVAQLTEGLKLRSAGVTKPIAVFNALATTKELELIANNNLDLVVHSIELVDLLERVNLTRPIFIWLKLDTGLHRLGIQLSSAEAVYHRLSRIRHISQPIGLLTHFGRAYELNVRETALQIARFDAFAHNKPGPQSLANSAGLLQWPKSRRHWVRPGIMLYGISSFASKTAQSQNLRPAMTLISKLISVRKLTKGSPVGYGAEWHTHRDTYIGVVAIGHGDGYRPLQKTQVLVNGRPVPVVGHFSMDMVTVDLGPTTRDKVGDDVIVWGPGLPLEQVAQYMNMDTPAALTTGLTQRVVRVSSNCTRV